MLFNIENIPYLHLGLDRFQLIILIIIITVFPTSKIQYLTQGFILLVQISTTGVVTIKEFFYKKKF